METIKIAKKINNDFLEAIVVFSFQFLVNRRFEKINQRRQKKGSKGKLRIPLEPSHEVVLENQVHKSSRRAGQIVIESKNMRLR
jgi:hypothetical protein